MDPKTHWEKVYKTKAPEQVSWYSPHLETSLALMDRSAGATSGSIIDVGGGHVIVSTFGPEGPAKCSGLDVARYDADSLHEQFGARFQLVDSAKELHQTPFGTTQQFLYCCCRIEEK